VTGRREIKNLSITLELINDKKEELEALVTSIINEALRLVREANIQLTDEVTRKFNEQLGT
jgi:DNA-binding protein YbaB